MPDAAPLGGNLPAGRAVRMARFVRRMLFLPASSEWRETRALFLLCAASGLCGALVFPKPAMAELAWFALVPFFYALGRLRGRCACWGTLVFGFLWFYGNLWWLNTLTAFTTFMPVGIAATAFICALFVLLFAGPASWAMRRLPTWCAPFVVAALWAGMEHARTVTDFAFPWNLLGHSQVNARTLTMLQVADIGGEAAVSFLVALANAALARLILDARGPTGAGGRPGETALRRPGLSQALLTCVAVFLILTVANIYGLARLAGVASAENGAAALRPGERLLRVGVVQPNVSQMDKWNLYQAETGDEERRDLELSMMRAMFDGMRTVAESRPRLVVLPEAVIASPWFVYSTELHGLLARYAGSNGCDLLFGADNRETYEQFQRKAAKGLVTRIVADEAPTTLTLPQFVTRTDENGVTVTAEASDRMVVHASAWQVKAASGLQPAVYDKVALVPFGEQVPLPGPLKWIAESILLPGSFQAGSELVIFDTDGVRYGAMICFESAFSALAAGLARGGAGLLCIITNDAWYDARYLVEAGGFWGHLMSLPGARMLADSGPEQHFSQAVLRAIETRRPVVVAANTGISAIVSPLGTVLRRAERNKPAVFVADVAIPDTSTQTFHTRHPQWLGRLCWWGLVAAWVALLVRKAVASRRGQRYVFP